MKKITAIVMAVLIMAAILVPVTVLAEPSPSVARGIVIVGTLEDLPEATADSPDFVFVQDESVVYVKYTDPNTGEMNYVPETQIERGYVVKPEQTWEKGSTDGLKFTSTASYDKFVDVFVDGQLVDASNYDASGEDITIVTLKASYLETLKVGDHTMTILSSDGSGSVPFHVVEKTPSEQNPKAPQTGDSSNTGRWAAIALITLGAIGVVALTLVKTRKSSEK